MSGSIGGAGGSVGSGEVMAWLAQHMSSMGEQIRDSMMSAETRVDVMNQLNELKGKLGTMKPEEASKVLEQVKKLEAECEGLPECASLQGDLGDLAKDLQTADSQLKQFGEGVASNYLHQQMPQYPSKLQTAVDALGKDDQLAMIKLQDAISRQNESIQMVSAYQSAQHNAAMSVIGNIRG